MGKIDLNQLINESYSLYRDVSLGTLPNYIPELANANPNHFAISVTTLDGKTLSVGESDHKFTIQSISKPFVFSLALDTHGMEKVRARVDVEPTGDPFHSVIRLDAESKRPYNPLVNTGAIAMTDLIEAQTSKIREEKLLYFLETFAGRPLKINEKIYHSEQSTGHRNRAIAYLMLHFKMIGPNLDETLDLYFKQCSIDVNTKDLSVMASTFANNGINPITKKKAMKAEFVKHVLTIMFTCGLYTDAGEWAFDVGFPAKSGVSGGILGVIPGVMGIGIYSPLLDSHGNSIRARKVCEHLSKKLGLHIFDQSNLCS